MKLSMKCLNTLDLITNLFNLILESGTVPESWCIGILNPIYKNSGCHEDTDNYRGITLLSCLAKVFTACLNKRLTSFLDGVGHLGQEQAGFREGYSTMDNVFILHCIVFLSEEEEEAILCFCGL